MAEKRVIHRINCAIKCFLYHDGSKHPGAIMNISISGALITLNDPGRCNIRPKDICSFILSNEPSTSFCRYKSQVVRVAPPDIGLKILEHNF